MNALTKCSSLRMVPDPTFGHNCQISFFESYQMPSQKIVGPLNLTSGVPRIEIASTIY